MTLKECYAALNGDYEEAMGRLRSERLVQKFVLKFLDDGSFDLLCRSMEAGDQPEAFRAAHTIKGVRQYGLQRPAGVQQPAHRAAAGGGHGGSGPGAVPAG